MNNEEFAQLPRAMNAAEPEPGVSFESATPAAMPMPGKNGTYLPPGDEADAEFVVPPPVVRVAVTPAEPLRRATAPFTQGPGRVLPHSLEAEEALLSNCILDDGLTLARAIAAHITPASFYDPKHGVLFGCLLGLHKRNSPIEISVVAEELKTTRQLDQVGGYAFLSQVSSLIPTTAQASYFIQKVLEQATLREIIRAATSAVEDCHNYSGDLPELTDNLTRRLTFAIKGRANDFGWPAPVAADEFCANPPPTPPELIEGILYAGGTMLLSGPSKSHKTFSALDAGIAIASGERWLGHKTNKSVVLYLNLELQDFATADRISKITAARGHPPPNGLKVWNLRGHTITLDALIVQLPILIKQFGANCVCVDPHYKVSAVSGMEENSNDSQGKLLTLLEGLCSQAGAALIITHHFAKGDASSKNAIDRASGGGVFARWGDVMMTFSTHEQPDCMSVEMSLRNFKPVEPFVVRWVYPRWQRDDSLDPSALHKKPGTFEEKYTAASLLDVLGSQKLNSTQWRNASGLAERTFYRKRQELIDKKFVHLSGDTYVKS